MNRVYAVILIVVLTALGAAACTPPARPPLPTVAVLPSDTATLTPSKTFTPTDTPTPTNTFTPTPTNTHTPTRTFTPSVTPTPTDTATPTSTETPLPTETPTKTETPTRTPTRTPSNTFTPSNTPTPTPEPVIRSFTVDPPLVQAGMQVVARWDADADRVELDVLIRGNALLESNPNMPANGARTFTIQASQGLGQYTFRLTAFKGRASKVQTVDITVTCANQWFFSPAPLNACPQQQQTGSFVFQTFQNGVAFYVPNNNTLYFLASGGALYSLPNDWNTSLIVPTQVPPAGLLDPTGPIGYAWKNRPWPDGRSMVTVMGWATASPVNYSGIFQAGPGGEIYIRGSNNVVYRIVVSGTGGSWTTQG